MRVVSAYLGTDHGSDSHHIVSAWEGIRSTVLLEIFAQQRSGDIMNMKALLVGDNSSNPNWGGRGASMALYDMLERRFEVSAAIRGSAFSLSSAGFGYIDTLVPRRYRWIFLYLVAGRSRRKLFDYFVRFQEFLGAKDFISIDPEETVRNILASKERYPEIGDIFNKAAAADILILNGEGDLVFTTPPRREALFLLGMAALGVHLGKKVAFVNALVSDCPVTGRNVAVVAAARRVLAKCDAVILRDRQSYEFVRNEMPEVVPHLIPDSLFSWYPIIDKCRTELPANGDLLIPFPEQRKNLGRIDLSKPYICIGGSAAAVADYERAVEQYSQIVEKAKILGYEIYLTENDGRDRFLRAVAARTGTAYIPVNTSIYASGAILANARLFISGRYHPTILASIGGTPCVFLGSTAHKMGSLQEVLEYDYIREFPVFPSADDCDEIVRLARKYLDEGDSLRERIRSVARRRCDEALTLADTIYDRVAVGASRRLHESVPHRAFTGRPMPSDDVHEALASADPLGWGSGSAGNA